MGGASAQTLMVANYIPGPYRNTDIRFDFQQVTAWHAPDYEYAREVIRIAKVQTIELLPEVNFCCASPVEIRVRPSLPDGGRDLTKLAIIVILAVVVLGTFILMYFKLLSCAPVSNCVCLPAKDTVHVCYSSAILNLLLLAPASA